MTKKRWIVLAGLLAACVCLTLAVLALLPPRPGVTPANIERIENGMTRTEVETILGGPGRGLSRWRPFLKINKRVTVCASDHPHDETVVWHDPPNRTYVIVYFDGDIRVTGKTAGQPATFLQKLRHLLHL
jgi:hypothetical protein